VFLEFMYYKPKSKKKDKMKVRAVYVRACVCTRRWVGVRVCERFRNRGVCV
jgi:hypothetical protein